jgi:GAF domain-containing protein
MSSSSRSSVGGGVGAALYPLLVREELVGVLGVWAHRTLTDEETAFFELFAGQAAIAIKGAELFSALERANLVLEAENSELRGAAAVGGSTASSARARCCSRSSARRSRWHPPTPPC